MSAEMWKLVVVAIFFVLVLIAWYQIVPLPGRWAEKLEKFRQDQEGGIQNRR